MRVRNRIILPAAVFMLMVGVGKIDLPFQIRF
jgi:hypothetical protein